MAFATAAPMGAADGLQPHISLLISKLGDNDFEAREKAERSLRDCGMLALPQLCKAARDKDPERERRANRIIDTLRPKACPFVREFRFEKPVNLRCVRFSPDGKLIAVCGDYALRVWEIETGQLLHDLKAVSASALEFEPDGAGLWVGGSGWLGDQGTVVRVDLATGKAQLICEQCERNVGDLKYLPDKKRLFVGAFNQVITIDPARGTKTQLISFRPKDYQKTLDEHRLFDFAPNPNSKLLAVGCSKGTIFLIDVNDGTIVKTLIGGADNNDVYHGVDWSPDGKRLAAAFHHEKRGGLIQIWSPDGDLFDWKGYDLRTWRVKFIGEGRLIVTIGADKSNQFADIWNSRNGNRVSRIKIDPNDTLALDLSVSLSQQRFAYVTFAGVVRIHQCPDLTWTEAP